MELLRSSTDWLALRLASPTRLFGVWTEQITRWPAKANISDGPSQGLFAGARTYNAAIALEVLCLVEQARFDIHR